MPVEQGCRKIALANPDEQQSLLQATRAQKAKAGCIPIVPAAVSRMRMDACSLDSGHAAL